MECNQKPHLEADKALVLKMFESKLATLFGFSYMEGTTAQIAMITKDTWLPAAIEGDNECEHSSVSKSKVHYSVMSGNIIKISKHSK
eukprot:324749-Ditylum_brightwellii.AAC.1